MIVSLTQFGRLAVDVNGRALPLGTDRITSEVITVAGAFTALNDDCRIIRVATDTAIHIDTAGGAVSAEDEYMPAGSVEFFAVNGGETITIAAA